MPPEAPIPTCAVCELFSQRTFPFAFTGTPPGWDHDITFKGILCQECFEAFRELFEMLRGAATDMKIEYQD